MKCMGKKLQKKRGGVMTPCTCGLLYKSLLVSLILAYTAGGNTITWEKRSILEEKKLCFPVPLLTDAENVSVQRDAILYINIIFLTN